MKNSAAQTSEISIVWPKSGCRISGTIVIGSSAKARISAGSFGAEARPPSVKAQAARITKAGLMNSEGCSPKIQRREPLTSAPNSSAATISAMLTTKRISAARRTWRGERNEVATSSSARRQQQRGLAVDEMERGQAEAFGDRGARGERHHDADHHQRAEGGEQPAVDAAHPIGDRAAFGSRNHAGLLSGIAARRSATSARKRSPRASKLAN